MSAPLRVVGWRISVPAHCEWCGTSLFSYGEFWKSHTTEQVTCEANDEDGMHEPAREYVDCEVAL